MGLFKINRERYLRTTQYFKNNSRANSILRFCYFYLPLLIFISYPIAIIYLLFTNANELAWSIAVPFGVFLCVTMLRVIIDEKRPYEVYGIKPAIKKSTRGKSMPSRHTASAFIIAITLFRVNSLWGWIILCVALIISLTRILAGVHFIRDVVAGIILSAFFGILFLSIFP